MHVRSFLRFVVGEPFCGVSYERISLCTLYIHPTETSIIGSMTSIKLQFWSLSSTHLDLLPHPDTLLCRDRRNRSRSKCLLPSRHYPQESHFATSSSHKVRSDRFTISHQTKGDSANRRSDHRCQSMFPMPDRDDSVQLIPVQNRIKAISTRHFPHLRFGPLVLVRVDRWCRKSLFEQFLAR